jgi:hypothetical protein
MDEHQFESSKMTDEMFNQNWENTIRHLEAKNQEAMKKEWEWAESPYANLLLLLNLGSHTPHQLFALFLDKLNIPLDMRAVIESFPTLYNSILRRVEYMIRRSLPSPGKTRPGDVDEAFGMASVSLHTSGRQTGKSLMNLHVQSSAEAILAFIFKGANMDVTEMVKIRDIFYSKYPDPIREGRHGHVVIDEAIITDPPNRMFKTRNSSISGAHYAPVLSTSVRPDDLSPKFVRHRVEEPEQTDCDDYGSPDHNGNHAAPSDLLMRLMGRI